MLQLNRRNKCPVGPGFSGHLYAQKKPHRSVAFKMLIKQAQEELP